MKRTFTVIVMLAACLVVTSAQQPARPKAAGLRPKGWSRDQGSGDGGT
jgi:hypothetical protein